MRLIDADAVRDDFVQTVYAECLDDKDNIRANRIIDAFNDLPTIEAEPVIHAKWEICCDSYYPYCSHCKNEPQGHVMTRLTKYCPNCGARMDG